MPYILINPDTTIEDVVNEIPQSWSGATALLTPAQHQIIMHDDMGHAGFKYVGTTLVKNNQLRSYVALQKRKAALRNRLIAEQMRQLAASQIGELLAQVNAAPNETALAAIEAAY